MKKLSYLFLTFMLMLVSFSFTACSDDDDENVGNVSDLYGRWIPVYTEGYERGGGDNDEWSNALNASNNYDDYSSIDFKDDGTVGVYEYRSNTWKYSGNSTYELDGNKIYLDGDYDYPGKILKLTSSELVLETYEKETYEGITYEYYEKVTYNKVR